MTLVPGLLDQLSGAPAFMYVLNKQVVCQLFSVIVPVPSSLQVLCIL